MQSSEAACLADPRAQEEIRALHIPEEAVVCVEPWAYETDGTHNMTKWLVRYATKFHPNDYNQCYFYPRLSSHRDANRYAYPLDLCVEMCDNKVVNAYG